MNTKIVSVLFSLLAGSLLSWSSVASAQDSLCAEARIEIAQDLTLERQAFDARMRINNGMATMAVENVQVEVSFSDENGDPVHASSDPNDTSAAFFIRIESLLGIGAVDGSGSIAPGDGAEIHWLIIPAPGTGGQLAQGVLYSIGATLTYVLAGEQKVVTVAPDTIFVRPTPLLTLDYFLTREIHADDPFTAAIEPAEPFTLGLRVRNQGYGLSQQTRIDTAQPQIVENEQGLLINFIITASNVNDEPTVPSLLVNLGDIEPQGSATGRWTMETTLSGEFTGFSAEIRHADELGGEVTSLIEGVFTHSLIKDVRVDLPGRDAIRDFLARDGDSLRVYESHGLDTPVTDQSALSSMVADAGNPDAYQLSTPVTAGLMYVKLPDSHQGGKSVTSVTRSDGKAIPAENAWFSRERVNTTEWAWFFNLFDANSTGAYTLVTEDNSNLPAAPVLQFIPDQRTAEGHQLGFTVEASDPNGTLPTISVDPLPEAATFTDESQGLLAVWAFDWVPASGQAGDYQLSFTASDGQLSSSQNVSITVCPALDTDCDGMNDAWEQDHFGNLDRDGSGDFDGDGISDLEEFRADSNPTTPDGPGVPLITAPQDQTEVPVFRPLLSVANSSHGQAVVVDYRFEVYADEGLTDQVTSAAVAEGAGNTSWTVDTTLEDNHWYWWRVRACNGLLCSEWANAAFFVNTVNDPPEAFNLSSPANGVDIGVATPTLSVTNSVDRDGDAVTYGFEVFADSGLSTLVASVDGLQPGDLGSTEWTVDATLAEDTIYYWRATATDEHGARTVSTEVRWLFVNTINSPPGLPTIVSPAEGDEVAFLSVNLVAGNALDPDDALLNYWFELDTRVTFDSPERMVSEAIPGGAGTTGWTVGGLSDNTRYYWRVKACDGFSQSEWVTAGFFVNLANEPPATPVIVNPGDGAWVETLRPTLSLGVSNDPDGDPIDYRFEVYAEGGSGARLAEHITDATEWVLDFDLDDNSWFGWRALARDDQGAESPWSGMYRFFVDDNGVDDPPTITVTSPATDLTPANGLVTIAWEDTDPDSNASIALYYSSDQAGSDATLISEDREEDPDGASDRYDWDVSSLAPGAYYLYARIADATSSVQAFAPGRVLIPPAAENQPPIAEAGPDAIVRLGSQVHLDGTQSVDPDNGPAGLNFHWSQQTGPGVALSGVDTVTLTFTPLAEGVYTLSLRVFDGEFWSAPDLVTITVPLLGDIDGDSDVDRDDIKLISAVRNTPANGPNDLRDLDADGMITGLDARKAILQCTRYRCATQ